VGWLDLSSGPLWFHVPKIEGRYYTFQLWTATPTTLHMSAHVPTSALQPTMRSCRRTGRETFPQGLQRIEAPTSIVWMLGRILAGEAEDDLRVARALQRQFTLARLGDFGKSLRERPIR
jgi:hypothetical protein